MLNDASVNSKASSLGSEMCQATPKEQRKTVQESFHTGQNYVLNIKRVRTGCSTKVTCKLHTMLLVTE